MYNTQRLQLWKHFVSFWDESFLPIYQHINWSLLAPFRLTQKRCIVQLQSFSLIEELAKRPLTCGSLPHCAPGRGEQPHHLGGESCAENWLILYGLWCLIPTGCGRYQNVYRREKNSIKSLCRRGLAHQTGANKPFLERLHGHQHTA